MYFVQKHDMPDGGIMFKALGPASLSSQANILSHLVLSKNKLDQVPTQAIKSLHNLYHLNLNHGRLSYFTEQLYQFTSHSVYVSCHNVNHCKAVIISWPTFFET